MHKILHEEREGKMVEASQYREWLITMHEEVASDRSLYCGSRGHARNARVWTRNQLKGHHK